MAIRNFDMQVHRRMMEADLVRDTAIFGRNLFRLIDNPKPGHVEEKTVSLFNDRGPRSAPGIVRAYHPLTTQHGVITLRSGYRNTTQNRLVGIAPTKFVEIVQFDEDYPDVLSGVADRELALIGYGDVLRTPLGEIRNAEVLGDLIEITRRVVANARAVRATQLETTGVQG